MIVTNVTGYTNDKYEYINQILLQVSLTTRCLPSFRHCNSSHYKSKGKSDNGCKLDWAKQFNAITNLEAGDILGYKHRIQKLHLLLKAKELQERTQRQRPQFLLAKRECNKLKHGNYLKIFQLKNAVSKAELELFNLFVIYQNRGDILLLH